MLCGLHEPSRFPTIPAAANYSRRRRLGGRRVVAVGQPLTTLRVRRDGECTVSSDRFEHVLEDASDASAKGGVRCRLRSSRAALRRDPWRRAVGRRPGLDRRQKSKAAHVRRRGSGRPRSAPVAGSSRHRLTPGSRRAAARPAVSPAPPSRRPPRRRVGDARAAALRLAAR
ncbi:hypothetical protein MTO96_013816 [Rhipicephalus appendiculatus]